MTILILLIDAIDHNVDADQGDAQANSMWYMYMDCSLGINKVVLDSKTVLMNRPEVLKRVPDYKLRKGASLFTDK